jgi:hypothetical protein
MDLNASLSVRDAAERLRVSEQAIRHLAVTGQIEARKRSGAWWLDPQAVERRVRKPPGSGRPLSPAMAWTVLLLASGRQDVDALATHARQLPRARRWLEGHSLADDPARLRARARSESFEAHGSELPRILARDDTMRTGISAAELIGLHGGPQAVEAYAPAGRRETIVEDHALVPGDGTLLVRWVDDALWHAIAADAAPRAATLLDLLESDDPRARREAGRALRR